MIGGFSRPFFIRRYFIGLFLFIGLILGMVSSIVQQAQAAMNINRSINYQGRLLTNGGVNVADGVYAIKFSIYNVASAGTALWTASGTTAVPTSISIQVTDGLFSVLLGDTTFQGQNPFAFDFNQDGLYLGVSIAGDSEMTPRKRLSSVPYAFNSEALQGQFASSTDISGTSGTGTLFALNQASTTAASATRTTLLIETAGTSDFFDYLLRAKPKNGADVFSISRQGNVTSTGNFLIGDAPTDLFTVNAHINSDLIPSQDLVYSLGSASLRWNAQLGTVTSTDIFNSGTVSSTNLIVSGNTTLNNVTTTNLYNSGTVSTTQLFVNGTQISGGVPATTATLQTITTNGATTTHLMYAQGGIFSSASSTFTSDLTVLGQTSLQMLSFTNATGTAVTTTSLYVSGTASTSQLFVNGSTVCLANGINCPNTSTSSTWQYNLTNNIAYLTTSTMDVLMGGNTTATAGFIWDADTQGTSTLIIGGSTNTNVLVGTSTYGGGLSTNFGLNGNDLLAQGMIGSIEGLFSATGVSVGQGTVFADGNIYRTDGGIQFSPAAGFVVTSTSDILPSVDNSLSLGSNAYRWKGNFSTINAKNLTLANSGFNLDVVSSISVSSTAVDLINIKSFGRYVYGVSFVDNNLYIIDVFDPAFPKVINIIPIGAISPFDLDVDGKYVYVCSYTGGDLRIFDVADPLNASLLSTTTIGTGSLNGCRVKGKHVYLTNDDTDLLSVVDVTDARSPKIVSFGIPGYLGARGISIRGNYAYLAAKDTQVLNIVDISNPNIPVVVGTSTVLGDTWQVEVNSAVAVVTNYTSSTISVLDISQPSNPVLKSTLSLAGQPLIGKLTGNIFYTSLSGSADIIAIDVSSTTNPFVMATGTIPQPSPSAYGVDVSGQHIFVADETDGTLTIFKMSGISAQSLYSDSAQFGSLHVDQNAQIFGALTIGTSLQIGSGGIISNGALGISSTNTTSTILFAVSSTVGEFSNRLTVGGVNVCLADGTNCQSGGGGVTSSTWQYSLTDNIAYLTTSTMDVLMGGNTTDTAGFIWDADTQGTSTLIIGGTTNTNLLVGTTTYSGGLSSGFQLNGNDLFTQGKIGSIEGLFSATGVSVGTGTTVYADGNIYRTSGGIQFSPGSGANVSSTSNFVPTVDGSLSLGTSAFRWNAVLGAATATNVTTTNLFASGSVSTTNLSVGGFSVCLANGSNCPASSGSSTWQYNKTSNIAFLTTSTQDVLMGGGNTTSSALFVVDYRGNTGTATNTILLGGVTTTLVGIGTSTPMATLDVAGDISNILRKNQNLSVYRTISGVGSNVVQSTVQGNYLYVINEAAIANNFKVYDVSNPASSTLVGGVTLPSGAVGKRMTIVGTMAYVLADAPPLLVTVDISDPSKPLIRSSVAVSDTNMMDLDVIGTNAYVSSYTTGAIEKFDVSDPDSLTSVTQITSSSHGWIDVDLQGDFLYTTDVYGGVFQIYNVTSTVPLQKGELAITGAQGLAVQGRFAYVTLNTGGVTVVDISSSTNPYIVSTLAFGTNSTRTVVDGRYLYVLNETDGTVSTIDIVSSTAPVLIKTVTVGSTPRGLSLGGRYLYVSNSGSSNISIIDLKGTEVSSLTAANALIGGLQVQHDAYIAGTLDVRDGLTVDGKAVCLSDGTGCQPSVGSSGGITSSTWQYNKTSNIAFLTTSTQDVLMGGGNTTSSALFVVDYRGNTGTATNTILLGGVTTTFVGIGTSTPQTTLDVAGSVSNILRSGQTLSLYRNITGVGSTPNQVVVRGNYLHLINKNTAANNFKIFDVSNPASSTVVGTLSISSGTPERMSIVGNRAYVITESPSLLYAIDLSDRARPVVLSSVAIIDTNVRDIDVSGQYAYVSSYDTGSIEKFDISNPTAMTSVVQITSGTHSWLDVEVQGRYLYAVDNYTPTLQIYDASATTPLLKSELSITGAQGLSVQGRFAYVTLSSGGVQVVDIASSTRPIALGSLVIGTNSNRSTVDGRYLYISNESGSSISVVDVSSSTAPNLVRTVTVGSTPRGLSVAGRYLYVPNSGATTISIIDLLGTEVSSLTAANALIGGLQVLQDMMVQGNMDVGGDLTVGGVNVCLSDGTNCPAAGGSWTENATNNTVSLATVSRDVLMGGNTTDTAGFIWDKDVNGTSTLFVGATTNTNIVFGVNTTSFNNITGLSGYVMDGNDLLVGGTVGALNGLAVRGNIDAELGVGQQFKATTTNYLSGYSGPITVHGRYLYQAESSGLVIYDLGQSGKESPKMVTAATNYYSGGNYNDITYFNGYILLSSSDGYTVVVDVSSSTNPIALTQWGNGGGTNRQHSVPHPNGRYVYTTNGLDGINVTDMIDPLNPVELFTTSTNNASDAIYDMKTDGRYLYVANASTPSMEIYDLKIPTRPILISRITTGLSAITKLVVQDDYAYIVEGPAYNEIEIVDIKDRKNPKIVKTITPDGTNRADQIIVAGKYMYLGSLAPEGIDIYDISSSTNPIFIQTIADANIDPGNMILVGKTLYTSGLNTIGSMDVGGIEVNALKAYTAEMTRLLVRDSLDVFQDARIEGGLTVGSLHSNQSYGSISVYASTTSGTVMSLVNESYNSLDAVLEVRGGCGTTSTRDLALFGTRADSRKVSIRCDGQIYADNGTISTPADYAEYFFASSSDLVAGDAVVLNTDILAYASTSRAHILKGDSDLRAKTLGIISTQPGFVANGAEGREQDPQWKVVALMGQVPAKADATAAAIKAGDDVMVGDGGVIIKARGPGMVIGRALEPLASGTSTIQVYVQPHWWAGELFTTDNSGNALLVDDITVASSTVASTTSSLVDSPYFTFMSKAWDAVSSTEVTHSFKLFADAISPTTSLFSIVNASGTSLLDLSNEGDLTVHGKLYLANKSTGIGSTSTYLFIDDTTPSSTMVSTNADGFQAQTSFDYAERYPSQENLEPGDLVTFDPTGPALSMKRTTSVKDAVSGIVSTKPGFLTGAYVKGTYPIALAGRVPTKVTASNGSIKTGDALTASNIPGVAMKATQPGIIVGYALANFDLPETGLIEVFVKTGYFGGTVDAAGVVNYEPQNAAIKPVEVEGLALIAAGQQEVTIRFDSLKALPTVYAAPGASVDGGWWIASKTDTGFTIVLEKPQMHDVEFSWLARPLQMGVMRFKSDNTNETVDLLSGNGIPQVQDSGGGSPSSTSSTQTP